MKQLIKPIHLNIILDIIFSMFSNIALALLPYYTQELINGHVIIAVIGYVCCIFLFIILNYIQMVIEWNQAITFSSILKNKWFDALQSLSHQEFKKKSIPEYLSYQSNDLDALEKDYLPPLVSLYKQIIRIIIFSVVIGKVVNLSVAVIIFGCSLISLQIPNILGKKIANKRSQYLNKQGEYYDQLENLLSGHHLVDAENVANIKLVQRDSLAILQENYFKYGMTKSLGLALTGLSIRFTDIILFIYLALSIYNNNITIAQIVASLSYINAFSEPLQEILYDIQMLESVKPVKMSFLEIISQKPSEKKPVKSFQTLELKDIKKDIGSQTLTIPSITVSFGEKIVVIGENGVGKSSLLNIFNGSDADFSGQIFLDGKRINSLDGLFGKILQKDHAYKASYEDNISLFGSYSMKASTKTFFSKNGATLSGGEKQIMFLEREINRNSPLLIIDEPFSALDKTQFDRQLKKVLDLDSTVILTIHQNDEILHKFSQVWRIANGSLVIEKS